MPKDRYGSFEQLAMEQREGRDFAVRVVARESPYAIIAPHGGKIELGTSEVALGIAGEEHALYLFEGLKAGRRVLHITSEAFDEPRCLTILRAATTVVTIHGMAGAAPEVHLGGLDESLVRRLEAELKEAGFTAHRTSDPRRAGTRPNNLCNRGNSGRGCQLEISRGLRDAMMHDLTPNGRDERTEEFRKFVRTVRDALE